MTAPTPEQMRALADKDNDRFARQMWELSARATLRAAADQLQAVRSWADEHYHHFQEISELEAILNGESDD